MPFQIHALPASEFETLFKLDDAALHARKARRETVRHSPGTPCRVSLADAQIGETVILTNHTHLQAGSPYDATHAIFVRQGATTARPAPGEVPEVLERRQLSLRAFDTDGVMRNAALVPGTEAAESLARAFDDPAVEEVHIHYAAPGCFAARATRADNAGGA